MSTELSGRNAGAIWKSSSGLSNPQPGAQGLPGGAAELKGPRCPCVLCLDGSSSMHGEAIQELNAGLRQFLDEVWCTSLLRERLDLAIVRFGDEVQVVRPMGLLKEETIAPIVANGNTPLGGALQKALAMIGRRQGQYAARSLPRLMPWLIVMTDGQPNDGWKEEAWRVQNLANMKELAVLAIGVGRGADMGALQKLCGPDMPPVRLQGLKFASFFKWLSESLALSAEAKPGDRLALPPPTGWAEK